tara:strand:- start:19311 stop:20357 length:1047 start_codon:yes stop_codon:yes gene_type:complete
MKRLSILSVSILLSLGLQAQDNLNTEDKKNDTKKVPEISNIENLNNSLKKSQFRNEKATLELENAVIDRQIELMQKTIEKRKLEWLLSQDTEILVDKSEYSFPEPKDPAVKEEELKIEDPSLNFNSFSAKTYEADQIIKSTKKEKKQANKSSQNNVQNGKNGQTENRDVNSYQQNDLTVVKKSDDEIIDLSSLNNNETVNTLLSEEEPKTNNNEFDITDEELAAIGISREEYEEWVAETENNSVEEEEKNDTQEVEKEQLPTEYLEIKNVKILKTFIFNGKKIIDLSVTVYIGDDVNGNNSSKRFKNIKESDILVFNDYKLRINSITGTEVEIENLDNGKIYVASNYI